MACIQGYTTNISDSEFNYLANLQSADEKRSALDAMMQKRFVMGREYGKTVVCKTLLENLCGAISEL